MRFSNRPVHAVFKSPPTETDEQTGRPKPPSKSDGKGTPQGGVISPLLANVYLHWFDVMFHRQSGPRHWANARLVRYADDFVVMARYQGQRIDKWLDAKLEGWLGRSINREKTKVVNLDQAESLDFLGFTFRYDRDLYGSDKTYLNVTPSKKSLKKARDAIRENGDNALEIRVVNLWCNRLIGDEHLPEEVEWKDGFMGWGAPST